MNKNILFSVIGGDLRQIKLASILADSGYNVKSYGFDNLAEADNRIIRSHNLEDALSGADCIVLGLPFSNDGVNINAPFATAPILLNDIYKLISQSQCPLVVGGKLTDNIYKAAGHHGFKCVDYFEREELAVLNAIPTAEGAIQLAMEELPVTIHGSKTLVIGYGRIGKTLSHSLKVLGSDVTVSARKHSDFAWIKTYGLKAAQTASLNNVLTEKFDVIFNTVPKTILNEDILKLIHRDTLIIDLASKPGGVDLNYAGQLGLKVIWALSLPGKVAPVTSGEIIKSAIINILMEEVP